MVKTKKTELLFLTLFIRLLKPGGRAAVIVPDGVLFGSTKAHRVRPARTANQAGCQSAHRPAPPVQVRCLE